MYLVAAGKFSWIESCKTKKKVKKAVAYLEKKGYKRVSVYKKVKGICKDAK